MKVHTSQAGPEFLPADRPAKAGRPGENLRVLHRFACVAPSASTSSKER
jgi:hypothetical protein